MIPNNNLSVLPFYTSLDQQNARKWWTYGRVYPLYCPAGFLLPFQIIVPHNSWSISNLRPVQIIDANTNQSVADITNIVRTMIYKKEFTTLGYDVWVFPGQLPVINALPNGRYYLMMVWGYALYSEIFTVVNDIQPYLKITWWDIEDFTMDAGTIVYTNPLFKNVLYLKADLAKPEYPFEEEGENRDGYFFPTKQISEKRYRFAFFASEYLLDVMRFIRMADFSEIEYHGQRYSLDTFLITPEWEDNGDVAAVEAVFDTATVAKKIGLGYVKAQRGDFNDDFNSDFNNSGTPIRLLSVMPLVIGESWFTNSSQYGKKVSPTHQETQNNKRASQPYYVDISGYGFGTITLKAKAGYKFAAYFGNTDVPDTPDANAINWGYTNSGNSLTINLSGVRFAIIMVAANNDATLTSTDWSTYIEES